MNLDRTGEEQLVVFRLAEEHYGFDIAGVREIILWQPVTRLPKVPSFVEGVINLRNHVIPIIDLRRRFELPDVERGRETRIMVVEVGGQTVGLVVDAVTEVLSIQADMVESPEGVTTGVEESFIRGVAKVGDRLIVLLALEDLLEGWEHAVLSKVRGEQEQTRETVGVA